MPASQCQVDFYVLQDLQKSVQHLGCQLAMMAWQQGMYSLLLLPDANQARQMDELMWSLPQGRFLPHELISQAGTAPVSIGTLADLDNARVEVVINLDSQAVPRPERFRRLLELVPARDAERQASRVKFRAYKDLGLEPNSHTMS